MGIFKKMQEGFAGKNRRKMIENAAIILAAGIIILIMGNGFFGGGKNTTSKTPAVTATPAPTAPPGDILNLEARLKEILSKIKGAGEVSVLVTYETIDEVEYVFDSKTGKTSSEESDAAGGKRSQETTDNESSVAYSENNGSKDPIISARIMPAVKGVVVVCTGGNDINVRNSVSRAVQALTGVAAHKIEVLPAK